MLFTSISDVPQHLNSVPPFLVVEGIPEFQPLVGHSCCMYHLPAEMSLFEDVVEHHRTWSDWSGVSDVKQQAPCSDGFQMDPSLRVPS